MSWYASSRPTEGHSVFAVGGVLIRAQSKEAVIFTLFTLPDT